MLYLVATPIGNLKDFSYRAIEILNSCDLILCEDTRHSQILLHHYNISKPLKSYHKFNEAEKEDPIISELQQGKKIGLISDAGTPGISDPGARLVEKCRELGIPVTPIPGACAAIAALSASGLNTDRFQFIGFLPKKQEELRQTLRELLSYSGTTICYESPNRLLETLEEIQILTPDRKCVVARELTKKFEEFQKGNAEELLSFYKAEPVKGEIVLLIAGQTALPLDWSTLSPEEHVQWMQDNYSMTKNDAIKMVANLRGVPKRTIYNSLIK